VYGKKIALRILIIKMANENKHADHAASAPRKTVFVRNLPFTTTSKQLEELFSDDAPIKQAFVVQDKGLYNNNFTV